LPKQCLLCLENTMILPARLIRCLCCIFDCMAVQVPMHHLVAGRKACGPHIQGSVLCLAPCNDTVCFHVHGCAGIQAPLGGRAWRHSSQSPTKHETVLPHASPLNPLSSGRGPDTSLIPSCTSTGIDTGWPASPPVGRRFWWMLQRGLQERCL
jgi:hypothetical protein